MTGGRWLATTDPSGKLLIGGREVPDHESFRWLHLLLAEPNDLVDAVETNYDHVTITAANRARRLLGVDEQRAEYLFHGGNTKTRLHALGADIFGPRPAA
ncbi:hypothetical protein E1286_46095 [Nonomuraea terrae]|uniref:Uncharacterized protein n=1 Tax=Nonomuraea terrae TaxID=2530383 RepID=A0A4R4XGW6_9ACTN|nr:hypothetical protein [Nonomuraea terrae]TDD30188.1 hypothetical protein E1286_46095 [Nonomuraea terrae]